MRAGYDFLLLRCASGELDQEIGEWWKAFIDGDGAAREDLLTRKPTPTGDAPAKKRPRRRGGRNRSKSQDGGEKLDKAE
jgi:poly(A) polymerase